jgi:hypothetical protein
VKVQLVKAVVISVIVAVVAWGIFDVGGLRARPAFCIALAVLIGVGGVLVNHLTKEAEIFITPHSDETFAPEQRPYTDLYFLEYRLSWGSVERARFEQRVRPLLTRVIEERLRQRHGVDANQEPEKARRIVGEPLWQLMTAPALMDAPPPSHREVNSWVGEIEKI